MNFRTEVKASISPWKISHRDSIFCLGSCFSTEIYNKLNTYKFNVLNNPFGTLFHPIALSNCMSRIYMNDQYDESEITNVNSKFFSFDHSTIYTRESREDVLYLINNSISKANEFFQQANVFIITLGTAWVYSLSTGYTVANCHKLPGKIFNKRLLSITEIESSLRSIINMLLDAKNNPKVILTISPVRHFKDGLVENNQSKARLNVALQNILEEFKFAQYFPSYEYIVDELRDYRFYKPDMVHPTQQAIDFVWDKFAEKYLAPETVEIINEIQKVKNGIIHKSLSPNSTENKIRLVKLKNSIDALVQRYPSLNFNDEYQTIRKKQNEHN